MVIIGILTINEKKKKRKKKLYIFIVISLAGLPSLACAINNHYVGWTVILNFLLFDTDNYV